jgi:parallel beta-helix repeat protein
MNHSIADSYWNDISIWSNATWFNYSIAASDTSGNWNTTSTVNLNFRVHNLDTGEGFIKIQTAIDDSDTVDSHTIFVDSGIYYENVAVDKTINLTGEDRNTTIIDGGGVGDAIDVDASWVNITGFKITNASTGIRLDSSSNNSITRNDVFSNIWAGIQLSSSSNNTITNNNVSYNEGGIALGGSSNKITNNNIFSNNLLGISAGSGSNNSITSNNVYLNGLIGIGVKGHHNKITDNYIFSNSARGIDISSVTSTDITTDHKIINNSITNNSIGLFLLLTHNNLIIDNNIYSNNGDGIYFHSSNNNTIRENNISNNDDGIYLYNASNNTITNNNVSLNNQFGFYLWTSFDNNIYHNYILNNTNQAYDDTNNGNKWDNGYPSGGNYWSDYTGNDIFSGPNQDIPGNDGIGDTNYSIDSDSRDNYPLMPPIGEHIFLYQGWNLISIPFIQTDTELGVVLSSISGSYKAVQRYDAADLEDSWKHNCTTKPGHLNDLEKLNHTMGFWVYVTDSGGVVLEYSGIPPTQNQTITLYPGWNMVGYPSLTNKTRDTALNTLTYGVEIDSIWTFDAATQSWEEVGPSDSFQIGRGYWIHATQECEWEVPV